MFIIRMSPKTTSQKILTPSNLQDGVKAGHSRIFLTDRLLHQQDRVKAGHGRVVLAGTYRSGTAAFI